MDMEEDFPIKKAKARVEDSTHKKEREKARVKAIPRAVDVADLPLVEAEVTTAAMLNHTRVLRAIFAALSLCSCYTMLELHTSILGF